MKTSSGALVAKYQAVETVHAEQWDGSDESTANIMNELAHHELNPTYHPADAVTGLQIRTTPQIWFKGGMMYPGNYLVKSEDGVFYVRGQKLFEAKFKKVG